MTVKEETIDGLTATTEETSTTRQQEETTVEPNLTTYHRRSTKNQTPSQDRKILGLGFLHTSRCPFASPRDSLESRSLSSGTSVLRVLITWRQLHCVEDEDTVIFHIRAHGTLHMATLILDTSFITNGYTNWKDAARKNVGFSQHETWSVSPGSCREKQRSSCHDQGYRRAHNYHQPTTRIKITNETF